MEKLNILLISKNDNVIEYLNKTLRLKYSLITLDNYEYVIDYYKSGRSVNLLICDIDNINEFLDFKSSINSHKNISKTPILCLVDNKDDEVVCFNNKVDEVIIKPVDNYVTEYKIDKMISFFSIGLGIREKKLFNTSTEADARLLTIINNLDSAYAYLELDIKNLKAKVIYTNEKYFEVFKVDKKFLTKKRFIDFDKAIVNEDKDKFIFQIKDLLEKGEGSFSDTLELYSNIINEKLVCKIKCIFDNEYSNGNPRLYCIFDDVTEVELVKQSNKKYQEELTLKYTYDDLTKIFNRQVFEEKTELLFSFNPNITYYIICFNISKFKLINETLGLEVGDQVLVGFSKAMSKFLNGLGSYGRLRDDDFVLSIPKSSFDEEKFAYFLEHALDDLKINYRVITYAGIYEVTDKSLGISHMIDRATLALESDEINYLKRYAFYNEALRESLIDEQEIEKEMVDAIEGHQFEIYLQPIYSLSLNNVCKAETLVRWIHPVKGMISPGKFIPIFEKNGFIINLDHYVWEEACKYIRSRIDRKKVIIPLSINISRKDLYYEDTIDYISNLINKYNLKPEYLELEVTESAYVDDPTLIIDSVNEFKRRGFKVLMDDFGSGYSSFNTLKDLNVDTIKLDIKFLEDFETSSKTSAIITSIVRMAKWLNMDIIAEGVETTEEMNFLRSLGCDKIQGYLLSKPICIKDFEAQNKKNLDGFKNEFSFNENDYVELFETFSDDKRFDISMGGIGVVEYFTNKKLILKRLNRLGYSILKIPYGVITYKAYDFLDSVDKSIRKEFLEVCESALYTHQPAKYELKCKDYEGNDLYLDVYIRGLGKDKVSQFLCINFIDTTSRNLNEISLANNFNLMINNSPLGLFKIKISNGDYSLFDSNLVIAKLLGYKNTIDLEKNFSKTPFSHIQAKDLELVKRYIELCIKTDKSYTYNLAFLNVKNKIRRCNSICYKVDSIDKSDSVVQFIINQIGMNELDEDKPNLYPIITSVTEEIFEINTSKNTFTTLINSYLDGVDHKSNNYIENMKIVRDELVHPDDKDLFYNNLMRMFNKNDKFESFDFVFRVLNQGNYLYMTNTVVRVNDEMCYVINRNINDMAKDFESDIISRHDELEYNNELSQKEILEHNGTIIIEYNYQTDELYKSDNLNKYNINDINYNQKKLFNYYKDYIHEDDIEILNKFNNDLLNNNLASMTIRLSSTIGENVIYTYNLISSIRLIDKSGNPYKIITTIKDVNSETLENINTLKQKMMFTSFADSYFRVAHDLPVNISIIEVINNKAYPRYVTKSMCDLLGVNFNDIEYKSKNNIPTFNDNLLNNLNIKLPEYINDEISFDVPVSFVNANGKRIWTRIVGNVKAIVDGYKYYFCAIDNHTTYSLTDNEKVDKIFDVTNDIALNVLFTYNVREDTNSYYLMNNNHRISKTNEFQHFINYISASTFIHEDFRKDYLNIFTTRKITNKKYSGILEYLALSNGSYQWFRIIYHYVHDEDNNVTDVYGEIIDVHKQEVRRNEIIEMIETDHLSGLTNRLIAEGKITNILKNNPNNKYAFILLDIDYFKKLNDKYGHPIGDKIIQQVSDNIISIFGKANSILSRFGGDEFVCFIEYFNIKEITSALENLMFAISKINIGLNISESITLSIGISLNDKDHSFARIYDEADKALYLAKEKRNSYSFLGENYNE